MVLPAKAIVGSRRPEELGSYGLSCHTPEALCPIRKREVDVYDLSRSEESSSWMAVTAAIVVLLLTGVFSYAYFGSHVDFVTPDFKTDHSAIQASAPAR